jgi:hypothetical protein
MVLDKGKVILYYLPKMLVTAMNGHQLLVPGELVLSSRKGKIQRNRRRFLMTFYEMM